VEAAQSDDFGRRHVSGSGIRVRDGVSNRYILVTEFRVILAETVLVAFAELKAVLTEGARV
jgi:hypothetical protein